MSQEPQKYYHEIHCGAETDCLATTANLFMLAVYACKGIAKMWYEKVAYSYNYNNCVTINVNELR